MRTQRDRILEPTQSRHSENAHFGGTSEWAGMHGAVLISNFSDNHSIRPYELYERLRYRDPGRRPTGELGRAGFRRRGVYAREKFQNHVDRFGGLFASETVSGSLDDV